MAHGEQKLFGWFGINNGLDPDYLMTLLAESGEFFSGLVLLSLGHAQQKTLSDHPEG